MTVVTWIPSNTTPPRRECLASLVWLTKHFAKVGLVIASGLLFTYIVCAIVTTARLVRTIKMSRDQRIAATRTVYYLVISTLIMVSHDGPIWEMRLTDLQALVVPFFARTTMQVNAIGTSQIAEVALNVRGIIHLILHIFLRSNADITAIRPLETGWSRRRHLRLFGPSDLEMTMHITSPVLLEKEEGRHFDDDNPKLVNDLRRFSRAAKYHSSPSDAVATKLPTTTESKGDTKMEHPEPLRSPPQVLLSPCTPRKGSNYSIFPTFRSAMLRSSMSTTFSQDNEEALQPPKSILPFSHKREFSEQSSATVQFMCRLSNLHEMQQHHLTSPAASSFRLPLYGTDPSGVESPPISPLSARPYVTSGTYHNVVILPIQTRLGYNDSLAHRSRSEYLNPGWLARRQSRSRSQQERLRCTTMKVLPPNPPIESNHRPPNYDSLHRH